MELGEALQKGFRGRDRRLLSEWERLDESLRGHGSLSYEITERNPSGLPSGYAIDYRIKSICGVTNAESLGTRGTLNEPLFARHFRLLISLPENYPSADAPAEFRFAAEDREGRPLPLPWHPNIRYFGRFAGRVCLNAADTYCDLAWGVRRIARYLTYELYHAAIEPPYPEDIKVAEWVVKQGEPRGWIFFDQDDSDAYDIR